MFTFKCSTFYTIIQWNCCKHLSHFWPGSLLYKIGSENWFAVGRTIRQRNWFAACRTIRQRKLFRCRHFNFGNECYIAAANTLSAINANSLQATQFQQWIIISMQLIHFQHRTLIRSRTTQLRHWMLICCRQPDFGSESQIHYKTTLLAANADSLQTT